VAPVRQGGGGGPLLGHIVLYRDVTHEVEADRLKSEFVSVVSHELRTPMTSVKASLSLLLAGAGGALEPSARELLEIALRDGDRVAVRWWRDGDDIVTEVADQGPGIPADKLQTIFEPFRQLDSSSTREHGGAGLGLTISRGIVEALGGKLWAESDLGVGSRFF